MKKLLVSCLVFLMLISGCAKPEEKKLKDEYTELKTGDVFCYEDKKDLPSFMEHGTGILFLGFPECPWCQAYLPMMEEVLEASGAECLYYNIYTDKKADREYYDQIAGLLVSQNDTGEEIIHYDNDGKMVIYMPLALFIEDGRITAFDDETCMEDSSVISPEDYWTAEKKEALKTKLKENIERIVQLQKEHDAQGCDTGCEVKPGE